jgi:hypothetical protein
LRGINAGSSLRPDKGFDFVGVFAKKFQPATFPPATPRNRRSNAAISNRSRVDFAHIHFGLGPANSSVLKISCFCLSPFLVGVKFAQRQNV